MSAIEQWNLRDTQIAINDTRALTKFMRLAGFHDGEFYDNDGKQHFKSGKIKALRNVFPHRFDMPERLSGACWTMWKMVASGQIHGNWTFTVLDDDTAIRFYFTDAKDCAYARLIAGNDDRPDDGWVPESLWTK